MAGIPNMEIIVAAIIYALNNGKQRWAIVPSDRNGIFNDYAVMILVI